MDEHLSPEQRQRAEARTRQLAFAKRMENGQFRELFSSNLRSIFDQAVEQLVESGLHEEVGSLRYVLARLMNEEQDLTRLANNVARVVSVSIRTVQMHNQITGKSTKDLIAAMIEILREAGGYLPASPTDRMKQ